jgi:hypothetical protein
VRQLATVRQESYPDWGGPAELIGISGCVYNIVGWAFYSVVREQGANEVFFLFCFVFLWGAMSYIAPAGLKLTILLPQLLQCWDYMYISPHWT